MYCGCICVLKIAIDDMCLPMELDFFKSGLRIEGHFDESPISIELALPVFMAFRVLGL